MKQLVLMRHAKSDWSMHLEDHARPLNARGRRGAHALGDWLRASGYIPDAVLSSDAQRTRETFSRLELDVTPVFDSQLYLADPATMLRCLQDADGVRVLMIGHNPGIAALAAALVNPAPDHPRFMDYPTGATLVADFDVADWSEIEPQRGRCVDFVIPRALG